MQHQQKTVMADNNVTQFNIHLIFELLFLIFLSNTKPYGRDVTQPKTYSMFP